MSRARDIIRWVIARLLAHEDSITRELATSVEREALAQLATAELEDRNAAAQSGWGAADEAEPVARRSAQALEALTLLLRDWEAMPPAARELLRLGATTYLRAGAAITLDQALGLPSRAAFAREQRDHHAVEALRLLPGSGRARAAALRALLQRMAACGTWRRWRGVGGVPSEADALQRHAFQLLEHGPVPGAPFVPSDRHLRALASRANLR
ncbi:MAG: hypothetical protein ACK5XU_17660 [Pseudomonadota bacterium]|jgi:hypothetical protein